MKYCELFHHNLYWTQNEVSFGVWCDGQCAGILRIVPLGCEVDEQRDDPDAPRYAAYGIYSQVKLETNELNCTTMDFIFPACYKNLHRLLALGTDWEVDHVSFVGSDGGVAIDFRWREEGDLEVIGQLPAPAWSVDCLLEQVPLLLQKSIKTNVRFEFRVPRDSLGESCSELEKLLEYVRLVEEKESRSDGSNAATEFGACRLKSDK